MKIHQLLAKDRIAIGKDFSNKKETLDYAVSLMEKGGILQNVEAYRNAVWKREEEGTTGIGEGVAIPHGRSEGVKEAALAAMTIPNGVDYESLDGEPTNLLFLIAVPEKANDEHIKLLSKLSTLLMDDSFRKELVQAKSEEEFLQIIARREEMEKKPENAVSKDGYDLLAVTACPTGIAHTYMAAEALQKAAEAKGLNIKVETNGQTGVDNLLQKEEIETAKGIILATDTKVATARFVGKPVVQARVADGIHKASELIDTVMEGKAPIYEEAKEDNRAEANSGKVSPYRSLMNGVSNMLPFVIGGGILIALSFLLDDYSIDPSKFGSNTPIAALFNKIGGLALGAMLPILSAFIAFSIADRPGFVVGFVGGALAKEGGSGFLGALVLGFIAGYLMLALKRVFSKLPKSLEGIKPVLLYPLLGVLFIGLIAELVINPPFSVLNNLITNGLQSMGATSKILLGFVLGGMMSADMGGPINKAAYVFGTASLAEGSSEIMAAVMAGGMVPPLAIALAMATFRSKFTAENRKAILTNIIMGLSFITEAAIPFAAADPLRVLVSCIAGSGVAGALSMILGCSLRAPHGGLWVIGVIANPFGYLLAIVVGTVVAGLILGLWKKKVQEK